MQELSTVSVVFLQFAYFKALYEWHSVIKHSLPNSYKLSFLKKMLFNSEKAFKCSQTMDTAMNKSFESTFFWYGIYNTYLSALYLSVLLRDITRIQDYLDTFHLHERCTHCAGVMHTHILRLNNNNNQLNFKYFKYRCNLYMSSTGCTVLLHSQLPVDSSGWKNAKLGHHCHCFNTPLHTSSCTLETVQLESETVCKDVKVSECLPLYPMSTSADSLFLINSLFITIIKSLFYSAQML